MSGSWSADSEAPLGEPESPVRMVANVSGPLESFPQEFYHKPDSPYSERSLSAATPSSAHPQSNGFRSSATSPGASSYSQLSAETRQQLLDSSAGPPPLTTAKSQPVLTSRPSGSVRDIAQRLNQTATPNTPISPPFPPHAEHVRSRRGSNKSSGRRSPTKSDSSKLQKRRPGQPRSPQKTPSTSFETTTSTSSSASRPLFGEITPNYSIYGLEQPYDSSYGPLPSFESTPRRQSEGGAGSIAHNRSLSHHDLSLTSYAEHALSHRRSRSDMDALESPTGPGLQSLIFQSNQHLAVMADGSTRQGAQSTPPSSRIPVSQSRTFAHNHPSRTDASTRSASAMSNPSSRTRLAKSPSRRPTTPSKANGSSPSSIPRSNRYRPPPIPSLHSNQSLPAKIVAPPPQKSPPLRSSRPRLPVSSASTSASRARASERFQPPLARDGRAPSEEWLGKPYDAQQERTKRRIPELDKVDLAARRAKIQEAMAQHLAHSPAESSRSRSHSRRPSYATMSSRSGSRSVSAKHHPGEPNGTDLPSSPLPGLTVITDNPDTVTGAADDPLTANTDFEDESPVLGHTPIRINQPTSAIPHLPDANAIQGDFEQNTAVSSIEPNDDSVFSAASPDNVEAHAGAGLSRDIGSIRIMLDESSGHYVQTSNNGQGLDNAAAGESYFDAVPDNEEGDNAGDDTPHQTSPKDETLKANAFQPSVAFSATSEALAGDPEISRMLGDYQDTGHVSPEILERLQHRMVDLNRLSANGGSDGFMVQNLLDSILNRVQPQSPSTEQQGSHHAGTFDMSMVTPDTPPDAGMATGTAMVFEDPLSLEESQPSNLDGVEEDDFAAQLRKADEEYARHQRPSGDDSSPEAPPPPPKDVGYTPRSSIGPGSGPFGAPGIDDFRGASSIELALPEINASSVSLDPFQSREEMSGSKSAPPVPDFMPPPPPPADVPKLLQGVSDVAGRTSSDTSSRPTRTWLQSGSSRPSTDSKRASGVLAAAESASSTSIADQSTRHSSMEPSAENQAKLLNPQPTDRETKRLTKRRHIIKELLDTEQTYYHDLKIVEDIYRATAGDFVSSEDKKTLFGNCDEVERFSLHFYDELRKAVTPVYTPPKQMRWGNNRGSYSTTQSDTAGQASMSDAVDDEKDRATTVGRTFLANFMRMDQVYGVYLKNHDLANQRLSALKNVNSVKCWLDECHNNASDITSAWDLDSLLVKPTQRVSKYPMLLQQLLETTPADHPDHDALKTAARDSVTMLTRINDAKKRADLVDQIINRKSRDDVRTGLAKAFGRRTEKLRERVGIAEAWQDPEFDEISHKFGGHYIRLQICMRDVQDYINRIDKSMEQINGCASALELYTDVSPSTLPEIESKWRRYGQAIREIASYAFPEHKAAVQRRVIKPMVACIELHKGPQNAINQRKKRIVDYAKCKSIEKRGEKPDRKTVEASEMYLALNDHLKLELPRLYNLTATLVQNCLRCFLDIQLSWHNVWERKLRPTIDAIDIPASIAHIEPAFRSDYNMIKDKLLELGVCNGSILADTGIFLSPSSTLVGEESSLRRPADGRSGHSGRTLSMASDTSPSLHSQPMKRYSSGYGSSVELPIMPNDGRNRSSSSVSQQVTPGPTPGVTPNMHSSWSQMGGSPTSSRPPTSSHNHPYPVPLPRSSSDFTTKTSRPASSNTYVTARYEQTMDDQRFSGLFSSAMPPDSGSNRDSSHSASTREAHEQTPVMFVCASLFEFSIDRTRKEAGFPYLTYVQGEVFDVVAQKGELWLAKNQDDDANTLGWIWEQHFVILSGE